MVTAARGNEVLPKHETGSLRGTTVFPKWFDAGTTSIAIAIASARFAVIGHSAWKLPPRTDAGSNDLPPCAAVL